MNRKNGNIIWVLAGGYLVYTGGKLISEVIKAKPNLYQLMIVFGVVFVVFGGILAFKNIQGLLKTTNDEEDTVSEIAEEEEESEEADIISEACEQIEETEIDTGKDNEIK